MLPGLSGFWVMSVGSGGDTLHGSPASWTRKLVRFSKYAPEILQTYLERTGEHLLNLHHMSYLESISHFPALQRIVLERLGPDYDSDVLLSALQLWHMRFEEWDLTIFGPFLPVEPILKSKQCCLPSCVYVSVSSKS
ncbi:hypothetical protein F5146DRAFT_1120109 [Armillaria mellea]|nr:hypothetical protein F5146DRAFT_1120109 [Armillaria mellea]